MQIESCLKFVFCQSDIRVFFFFGRSKLFLLLLLYIQHLSFSAFWIQNLRFVFVQKKKKKPAEKDIGR